MIGDRAHLRSEHARMYVCTCACKAEFVESAVTWHGEEGGMRFRKCWLRRILCRHVWCVVWNKKSFRVCSVYKHVCESAQHGAASQYLFNLHDWWVETALMQRVKQNLRKIRTQSASFYIFILILIMLSLISTFHPKLNLFYQWMDMSECWERMSL